MTKLVAKPTTAVRLRLQTQQWLETFPHLSEIYQKWIKIKIQRKKVFVSLQILFLIWRREKNKICHNFRSKIKIETCINFIMLINLDFTVSRLCFNSISSDSSESSAHLSSASTMTESIRGKFELFSPRTSGLLLKKNWLNYISFTIKMKEVKSSWMIK